MKAIFRKLKLDMVGATYLDPLRQIDEDPFIPGRKDGSLSRGEIQAALDATAKWSDSNPKRKAILKAARAMGLAASEGDISGLFRDDLDRIEIASLKPGARKVADLLNTSLGIKAANHDDCLDRAEVLEALTKTDELSKVQRAYLESFALVFGTPAPKVDKLLAPSEDLAVKDSFFSKETALALMKLPAAANAVKVLFDTTAEPRLKRVIQQFRRQFPRSKDATIFKKILDADYRLSLDDYSIFISPINAGYDCRAKPSSLESGFSHHGGRFRVRMRFTPSLNTQDYSEGEKFRGLDHFEIVNNPREFTSSSVIAKFVVEEEDGAVLLRIQDRLDRFGLGTRKAMRIGFDIMLTPEFLCGEQIESVDEEAPSGFFYYDRYRLQYYTGGEAQLAALRPHS